MVETDWDRYEQGENSTWEGPGHGSVVEDGEGDWWLVYHSWRYGHLLRHRVAHSRDPFQAGKPQASLMP